MEVYSGQTLGRALGMWPRSQILSLIHKLYILGNGTNIIAIILGVNIHKVLKFKIRTVGRAISCEPFWNSSITWDQPCVHRRKFHLILWNHYANSKQILIWIIIRVSTFKIVSDNSCNNSMWLLYIINGKHTVLMNGMKYVPGFDETSCVLTIFF